MGSGIVVSVINAVAMVVQLGAAGLALTLIRLSSRRWMWIALTCALALQAWRRWHAVMLGGSASMEDSAVALIISVLMILVVLAMRGLFIELADAHSKLEHLAQSDSLTGVPNKVSFTHALDRAISRAGRGTSGVVLFLDIDGFKLCNDLGGHALGDTVLCEIASAYREQVRAPDMVARWGGDEFVVLLEEVGVEEGRVAAERLQDSVRRIGASVGVPLDLSVGMIRIGTEMSSEAIVAAADRAMYEVKQSRQAAGTKVPRTAGSITERRA